MHSKYLKTLPMTSQGIGVSLVRLKNALKSDPDNEYLKSKLQITNDYWDGVINELISKRKTEPLDLKSFIPSKEIPEEIRNNPEKYIPVGENCYTVGDMDNKCPFWDVVEVDFHDWGYCHYLKTGDGFPGGDKIRLLWDETKNCGLNRGD